MIQFEFNTTRTSWQLLRWVLWQKITHPRTTKLSVTWRARKDEYHESLGAMVITGWFK